MSDPTGRGAELPSEGPVARAVERLRDLDALPVEAHVEIYERVQAELDQALAHADSDDTPAPEPR
jgi:hypothetical protein